MIFSISYSMTSEAAYADIREWMESETALCLVLSDSFGYYLPKEAFTDEQWAAIKSKKSR